MNAKVMRVAFNMLLAYVLISIPGGLALAYAACLLHSGRFADTAMLALFSGFMSGLLLVAWEDSKFVGSYPLTKLWPPDVLAAKEQEAGLEMEEKR